MASDPHQVLEERRQLFGEDGELEEGRADLDVLPRNAVVSELLHGLDVLLLDVHMRWNQRRPAGPLVSWVSNSTLSTLKIQL